MSAMPATLVATTAAARIEYNTHDGDDDDDDEEQQEEEVVD